MTTTEPKTDTDELFIGGEWRTPSSSARITVNSASTEEQIGSVAEGAQADIDAAVAAARAAFTDPNGWGGFTPDQRADAMERLADEYDKRAGDIAKSVSSQNGMPIAIAEKLEAVFPSLLLRYYAGLATTMRTGLLGHLSCAMASAWDRASAAQALRAS